MEISGMWIWAAFAAVLLVGEMMTGNFVFIFFALAALVTAVVVAVQPMSFAVQLIIFAVIGLLGLLFGRKWIVSKARKHDVPDFNVDSQAEFTIDRELAPGAVESVLYQGSPWTAINSGVVHIAKGDRVRIVRTEGIKLVLQKVM